MVLTIVLSTFLLEKKSNENKSKSEDIKEDNFHKGINKIIQGNGDMNAKLDVIIKKLDYLTIIICLLTFFIFISNIIFFSIFIFMYKK